MSRNEFLEILGGSLRGLSQQEIEDILYDYEEHFRIGMENGKTEEQIANELGDPKNIARMYKASSNINEAETNPSPKNILKAIFSAMALGIFNFVIVFGPFIGIIFLLIALYGISVGLIYGGFATAFGTIRAQFLPVEIGIGLNPVTFISLGIGMTALGILLFIGGVYLTKLIYKGTVKYLKWNLDIIKK
jgi:uncharacterized membrane protein